MKYLCATLMALLFSAASVAEVYRWVDENGKQRFGDKAPQQGKAEAIGSTLAITNVDSASKNQAVTVSAKSEKTEDEKALEEKNKKQFRDAMGSRCAAMKKDIASIAKGERGVFLDEDGKEEKVLERDRGKKLEEWQAHYRKMGCEQLDD
jgi:hypothetical protein